MDKIGGQAHSCYDEIKTNIKADFISQAFNCFIGHDFKTHERTVVDNLTVKQVTHTFKNTRTFSELYKRFLEDMHCHSENAVIASNVVNAGSFQEVIRPKLHISRCKPLTAEAMETSPSSMNDNTWLIQHLASMIRFANSEDTFSPLN